ncbi:UTRA domain-containing protein [Streptomyces sp. 3MP-14]|uniref:UTRA domain-containing protein n=1 Tax=Streptomyces mimosae TaxID=2586635 RepID=A0A5N6A2X4_9ACTN|nr:MULTISPECIES: GntR family transcriptional regulator [Streptomyces]KAB8162266.1 UTRA domain-containing protein [Streptomyces mimosae]KAB8173835.1 UTRA domain-containing protein [Streptomyces sp. 3MP-14]
MNVFAPDSIDLNRKLPLWYQVSQSLRASILGRPPHAPLRLPTEEQLAEHFGVSVLTMRQALKELETEGLISRHRRRGTFIEPAAQRGVPVRLLGTLDTIVAQQSGGHTTLLDPGPVPVPVPTGLVEHFPGVAEVVRFRRLRRAAPDGEPVSWVENLIHPEVADRIDPSALERWPMTRVLRDVAGVRVGRVDNTAQARLADPTTARLLEVPLLSPILHITGVEHDLTGRVVDVALMSYRGDRFSFSVTVEAERGAPEREPGPAERAEPAGEGDGPAARHDVLN